MNTKKQYVQALTSHRTFIKGNYYAVVQDIFCGNMWNFPDVNSGECWLAPKQYFSEVVSELPKQQQYVQASETFCDLTKGKFYEVLAESTSGEQWIIIDDNERHSYWKYRFHKPVTSLPQKLENVFIRVDGESEKEAAMELLKSIGYEASSYAIAPRSDCIAMAGGENGKVFIVANPNWISLQETDGYFKELKVNKQVIPSKTVFTLAKQKLENVFIRVNGEAEKESAVELLKNLGYTNGISLLGKDETILLLKGEDYGVISEVSNTLWSDEANYKELKVVKRVIPSKTVFTLAKEKTYNIDGKELTRVEVEGMIQDMDIKMNCLRNMVGE